VKLFKKQYTIYAFLSKLRNGTESVLKSPAALHFNTFKSSMTTLRDLHYDCLHTLLQHCNLPTAVALTDALNHDLKDQTATALLRNRCTLVSMLSEYFKDTTTVIESLSLCETIITGPQVESLINGTRPWTGRRLTFNFADDVVEEKTLTSDTAIFRAFQAEGYISESEDEKFADPWNGYYHLYQSSFHKHQRSLLLNWYGSNYSILKDIAELSRSSEWVFATANVLCTMNLKATESDLKSIWSLNLMDNGHTYVNLCTVEAERVRSIDFRCRFLDDDDSLIVETPYAASRHDNVQNSSLNFTWIKEGYASYAAEKNEELGDDKIQFDRLEEHKKWLSQLFSSENWLGEDDKIASFKDFQWSTQCRNDVNAVFSPLNLQSNWSLNWFCSVACTLN